MYTITYSPNKLIYFAKLEEVVICYFSVLLLVFMIMTKIYNDYNVILN